MIFDWDPSKADSNQVKHGRTFGLAGRVFSDPKLIVYDVSREQDGEERQKAVGMVEGKLYWVVHTMRGEVCWIISARRTIPKEDKAYGFRPRSEQPPAADA
jgi:uncharacterized DUF497 family protein